MDKNVEKLDHVLSNLDEAKQKVQKTFNNTISNMDFTVWLNEQVTTCYDDMSKKKAKIKKIYKQIFRNRSKKVKRNILGDGIAYLTGLSSPSQSLHEREAIENMEKVLKGETKELNVIHHVLNDENDLIQNLKDEVNVIADTELKTNRVIQSMGFYLKTQHQINKICKKSTDYAEKLLDELFIIKDIKDKAKDHLPSEHIYPLDLVFEKVIQNENNEKTPFFTSYEKLEQIFTMPIAITLLNGTKFVSQLRIPLIDHTLEYNVIKPNLNDYELSQLEYARKNSHKSLSTFVCQKSEKTMKILSSSDLSRCLKSYDKTVTICEGRPLKQNIHDYGKPCQSLPKNLIIELDYDRIFVKIEEKEVTIRCGKFDEIINMNSTFSIFKLDPACQLIGKNFILDKVHEKISTDFITNPIEDIKMTLEHLPNPVYSNELNSKFQKIHNFCLIAMKLCQNDHLMST